MPAEFNHCRANGGSIKTITINKTQYMHVCYLNGKSFPGEVRTKVGKPKGPTHDKQMAKMAKHMGG